MSSPKSNLRQGSPTEFTTIFTVTGREILHSGHVTIFDFGIEFDAGCLEQSYYQVFTECNMGVTGLDCKKSGYVFICDFGSRTSFCFHGIDNMVVSGGRNSSPKSRHVLVS